MMKATRTFNNGLYQENLYQAYYNTPAEKHVVSESLEQEAMPVLVHRLAAQLGYTAVSYTHLQLRFRASGGEIREKEMAFGALRDAQSSDPRLF